MAIVGALDSEIADFIGCDHKTIANRFAALLRKARAGMRLRLRQAQYKLAVGTPAGVGADGYRTPAVPGNPTLCIWLGKQMLGQVDESRVKFEDVTKLTDEELAAKRKALGLG